MSALNNLILTVPQARQVAARTAARFGVPFDRHLISVIDDIVEDVILVQALGPERTQQGRTDAMVCDETWTCRDEGTGQ